MSIDLRRALAAFAVVVLLGGVGALQVAAQGDQRCFPETNLCISGTIRTYWERNGGLPVFGYPITPLQSERVENWTGPVQWFERDRLEDHSSEGIGVLAGRLGVERLAQVGRPWQRRASQPQAPGCAAFTETGYAMCGGFRAYWERNGGLARFGFPITDELDEVIEGKSYRVQYFERRRMEYHPEFGPGTVLLGLLGRDVRGRGPTPPPPPPVVTRTVAPTRTPTADDLGVAGNVGSFDNGGIVCDDGAIIIDGTQSGDLGLFAGLESPCVIDVRFEQFQPGQRIEALLRAPNGTPFAEKSLVAEGGTALWQLEILLGAPDGTYTLEIAPEGGAQLSTALTVRRPEGARALVLPIAGDLRDTFRVFISGLPADQQYQLFLYRRQGGDGNTAEFVRPLGTARTSGRGEGELRFTMQPGDGSAIYQVGYFAPPGIAQGVAACTADPRQPGGLFCFETFAFNP